MEFPGIGKIRFESVGTGTIEEEEGNAGDKDFLELDMAHV